MHADHLSAAPYIQGKLGGKLGIGENITVVQDTFGKIFNEGTEFQRDGSQFDRLFKDGDTYTIGAMTAFAMHTPGHTPACMTHVIGDAAFVGDTLFMPDGGSARADFPGGDAACSTTRSRRCSALPDETRLFMCHDYGPNGRDIRGRPPSPRRRRTTSMSATADREEIREDAGGARRHPRHAEADHPFAAGEHARRRTSAARRERQAIPEGPDQRPLGQGKGGDIHASQPDLADAAGWVDVDQHTLRHKSFANIWALGDVMNAPNAKTAAAARKQAPAVAENVVADIAGRGAVAQYDGYGSCPLTVERGKIVLAEFGYGGVLKPSFPTWLLDGKRPSRLAWLLKERLLPPVYWKAMLRGHEWLARPEPVTAASAGPAV